MTLRNRNIDGLRGMAAVLVVIFHMSMGAAHFSFGVGCTGVDLFFMISGYVMCMSMEKGTTTMQFAKNRFTRLYPTYWFCVTFTFILILASSTIMLPAFLVKYLANMTMFQYYLKISDLDPPYWTLAVELVFYFYILAIIYFKKQKQSKLIGLWTMLAIGLFVMLDHLFPRSFILHKILIAVPLIKYFPLFYAGMLFYDLRSNNHSKTIYLYLALALLFQVLLYPKYYYNRPFISFGPYTVMLSVYFVLFLLESTDRLPTCFSHKVAVETGRISYCLYLIHQYLSLSILLPFFKEQLHMHWLAAMGVTMAILWILAWIISKYIEVPSINYFRKLLEKRP